MAKSSSSLSIPPPKKNSISSDRVVKGVAHALHTTSKGARKFIRGIKTTQSRQFLQHSSNTKSLYDLKKFQRSVRKQAKKEGIHVSEGMLKKEVNRAFKKEEDKWIKKHEDMRNRNVRYNAYNRNRDEGGYTNRVGKMRQRIDAMHTRGGSALRGNEAYTPKSTAGKEAPSSSAQRSSSASQQSTNSQTSGNWQAKANNPLRQKSPEASGLRPTIGKRGL